MATISMRNTKNDIMKAYKTLMEEHSKMKSKLRSSEQSLKNTQTQLRKATATNGKHSKPITKTITVEKIVEKVMTADNVDGIIGVLKSVQEGIGVAINQCSAKQVIEAEALAELQEKIAEHTKELKELYDLEVELGNGTLDELIETYEKEQKAFKEAFKESLETFEEEHAEKQRTWRKEKDLKRQEEQERKALDSQIAAREREEYNYSLKLDRNNEDDIYGQKKKKLSEDLRDIEDAKKEEWKEKEKVVKDKEVEFDDYKKDYEELPGKLSKAVKKAEYEGTAIIERDAKVKMNMFKKEVESDQKANDMKIKSLEQLIKKQDEQVSKLTNQLENALRQAQALAIKAIEGSANMDSFDAIRAIAMEQAKHNTKSK